MSIICNNQRKRNVMALKSNGMKRKAAAKISIAAASLAAYQCRRQLAYQRGGVSGIGVCDILALLKKAAAATSSVVTSSRQHPQRSNSGGGGMATASCAKRLAKYGGKRNITGENGGVAAAGAENIASSNSIFMAAKTGENSAAFWRQPSQRNLA